ncbi:MAG: hypothetical protein H6836_04920 [Planctomycetes bacterium]|nr:hypothetical protein [Planctomycetota bacterium]
MAPAEMGWSRDALWRLVLGEPTLRAEYEAVFGAMPATSATATDDLLANLGKALEAYERRLISRDAPFDQFARGLQTGDQALVDRLSTAAQRGLRTFVGPGRCTLCHLGPTFTDGEFHNIGLPTPRGADVDVGRYDGVDAVRADPFNGLGVHSDDRSEAANMRLQFVTRKRNNLGEFKTPTLRNVAGSAPYMHDGRFATLEEVVDHYVRMDDTPAVGHREESLQPLRLDAGGRADLVAFLRSLTGPPIDSGLAGTALSCRGRGSCRRGVMAARSVAA